MEGIFFDFSQAVKFFETHDLSIREHLVPDRLKDRVTHLNLLLKDYFTQSEVALLKRQPLQQEEFILPLISSLRKAADLIKLYRTYVKAQAPTLLKATSIETKETKKILRALAERLETIQKNADYLENQLALDRFNRSFKTQEQEFLTQDLFNFFNPLHQFPSPHECQLNYVMQILAKYKTLTLSDLIQLNALGDRLNKLCEVPLSQLLSALETLEQLFSFGQQAHLIFQQTIQTKTTHLRELLDSLKTCSLEKSSPFDKKLFFRKLMVILSNPVETNIHTTILFSHLNEDDRNQLLEIFAAYALHLLTSDHPTQDVLLPKLEKICSRIKLEPEQNKKIGSLVKDLRSQWSAQPFCYPPKDVDLQRIFKQLEIDLGDLFIEEDNLADLIQRKLKEDLQESHFDRLNVAIAQAGTSLNHFKELRPLLEEYQKVVISIRDDLTDKIPKTKISTLRGFIHSYLFQANVSSIQHLTPLDKQHLYRDLMSCLDNPFDYAVDFYMLLPALQKAKGLEEVVVDLQMIENQVRSLLFQFQQYPPPNNLRSICEE